MPVIGRRTQSPNERLRWGVNYTDFLDDAETLSSITFLVTPTTTPPFSVDAHSLVDDDKKLVFYTSGGVDKTEYKVEIFATTSESQTKEDVIMFRVTDP